MEKILLYYPSTNIPDGKWLRNSLLYTDKVASILPYDMGSERISDETKLLFDEDLYQPIYVFNELNPGHPEFEKFENNFLDTIKSEAFEKILKRIEFYSAGQNKELADYEMFVNKLTYRIADYLRNNNLLRETVAYDEIALEKNTAIIYMSMLADYLARINKNLVIPSTDEREFETLAFQLADEKALTYRIQLDNCLPTPLPDANIKDIVKFKKKRKLELLNFREELEKAEKEINLVDDNQERKEKMKKFQDRIEKEIIEIKKLLGDSKLEFILNGFSSLLDFKQKEIVGTVSGLGIVGGGVIASLPLIGLGAGALLLTGTLVSSFKKINRQVEANSFSYIYYAQQQGILAK
jgi:hypothetical protein